MRCIALCPLFVQFSCLSFLFIVSLQRANVKTRVKDTSWNQLIDNFLDKLDLGVLLRYCFLNIMTVF